jgi:hypothetical protein
MISCDPGGGTGREDVVTQVTVMLCLAEMRFLHATRHLAEMRKPVQRLFPQRIKQKEEQQGRQIRLESFHPYDTFFTPVK